jgi:hypothetical protein
MTLTRYTKNFGGVFQGEEDFKPCYLAADVEAVLKECRALAAHVVKFPYGHNANGCVEHRDEVKARAQALLAGLTPPRKEE